MVDFQSDGRLTEHIAFLRLKSAPTVSAKTPHGRVVTFTPRKLVAGYQYSWRLHKWVPLYARVVGSAHGRDVKVTYPDPRKAPDWVQELINQAEPDMEEARNGHECTGSRG